MNDPVVTETLNEMVSALRQIAERVDNLDNSNADLITLASSTAQRIVRLEQEFNYSQLQKKEEEDKQRVDNLRVQAYIMAAQASKEADAIFKAVSNTLQLYDDPEKMYKIAEVIRRTSVEIQKKGYNNKRSWFSRVFRRK